MKILKKVFLAGLVIGLCALISQKADASVSVNFRFGTGGYFCGPPPCHPVVVYGSPCRTRVIYTSPVIYTRPYVSYAPYPYYYPYPPQNVVVVPQAPPSSESVASQQTTAVQPTPTPPPATAENSYYRVGRDWAKDLREDIATRDQFINYLKANIIRASTENYSEFRKGFIATYGVNAEAAFDKAYQQARGGEA